jgi:hypothetical protein
LYYLRQYRDFGGRLPFQREMAHFLHFDHYQKDVRIGGRNTPSSILLAFLLSIAVATAAFAGGVSHHFSFLYYKSIFISLRRR